MFKSLKSNGFLDNPNSIICSSVFAENERAAEVASYQLGKIQELVEAFK
jgi:myo-inositol catabolism protein IolH